MRSGDQYRNVGVYSIARPTWLIENVLVLLRVLVEGNVPNPKKKFLIVLQILIDLKADVEIIIFHMIARNRNPDKRIGLLHVRKIHSWNSDFLQEKINVRNFLDLKSMAYWTQWIHVSWDFVYCAQGINPPMV